MNKKIYISTFGCQMNVRDSEFISGLFIKNGYKLVDLPEEADIILFNTCAVRGHAEDRAVSAMGQLQHWHKNKIYGIVGCVAQALGDKLFRRLPSLNVVCGTGEIARIVEIVENAKDKKILALSNIDDPLPELNPSYRESDNRAYVSIMRGCNNFCSYCIVPYVRGKERSRKVENIVGEVKDLIKKDIKNITLLGQNVNSYNGIACLPARQASSALLAPPRNDEEFKPCDFVQLLRLINNISGIGKISFMTSHPKDAGVELFEAIRDLDHAVKHLHLPLQSGSDRILKLMKRGYTSGEYLEKINIARQIMPNVRLTTDIIVGFPGETEDDFKATFNMLKSIEFNFSYIFKYSPRSGTEASRYQDDVPREIKNKRHRILLDMQKEISIRKNK